MSDELCSLGRHILQRGADEANLAYNLDLVFPISDRLHHAFARRASEAGFGTRWLLGEALIDPRICRRKRRPTNKTRHNNFQNFCHASFLFVQSLLQV
jgi:hypothetical protein